MSYQLLSKTEPVARKTYTCIWCGEPVPQGALHIHEASKFNGDFQDHRWHLECYVASREHFAEEDEFMAYDFHRGTIESKWSTILGGKDEIGRIL